MQPAGKKFSRGGENLKLARWRREKARIAKRKLSNYASKWDTMQTAAAASTERTNRPFNNRASARGSRSLVLFFGVINDTLSK